MTYRLFSTALVAFLFALLMTGSPAQETTYQARTETSYQSMNETTYQAGMAAVMADTETSYNPKGTVSRGLVALLSTRRDDPAFPAFLLGMQDAARRGLGAPLNVAHLTAASLADQVDQLANSRVDTYLIDSPNPDDAKEFFERAKLLGRKATLISYRLPTQYHPPVVVDSPILWAERVGEEAIRLIGTEENEVAYVLQNTGSEKSRENLLRSFQKPFGNVAPKIKLVEIDPLAYTPGMVPPAAVCVITAEDSRKYAPILRAKFPDSKLVVSGEDPEVVSAFDSKLVNVRVRPDYDRLLGSALQESRRKSDMPIVIHPTIDRWWE